MLHHLHTTHQCLYTFCSGFLQFLKAFPPEVVEWDSDDDSGDIRLTCQIIGVARILPTVYFVKNGDRISPSSDRTPSDNNSVYISETDTLTKRTLVIGKRRGNEGVYQCVGQGGEDRSTSVTSSTYINIKCELHVFPPKIL